VKLNIHIDFQLAFAFEERLSFDQYAVSELGIDVQSTTDWDLFLMDPHGSGANSLPLAKLITLIPLFQDMWTF
jgi:hypothetical protein